MPQDGITIEVDQGEYEVEHPICCSVSTFLYTNYVWCLISFGLLVLGIVGVTVEQGVLVVLPPAAYFVSISIGLFGLFVISLGIIGQKKSVEICFLLYILLVSLGLIAQTLAYCYLLLYANDVSTISSLDNAAINAQGAFESNLVKYAQDEPAKWVETQNKLKCCGIDFEIGLFKNQAEIDVFESGNKCEQEPEASKVDNFRTAAELLNHDPAEDFEPAQQDDDIGAGTGFFCKDKISLFMVENTPIIAAVLAFILIIQIAALVSAARMYWVPDYLGGWLFDEMDLEEVAKRKGLKVPELPKENAGFTANLGAATQRLSFRFKNAFTADPNIPKAEGFMNRLSVTRGSAIAFGQPDPKNDPRRNMITFNPTQNPMGGNTGVEQQSTTTREVQQSFGQNKAKPPPGMFGRMSQRISLNHFGGGMFSFPKQQPINPPPGMNQEENKSFGNTQGPPGMTMNSGNFSAVTQSKRQPMGPPPGKKQMQMTSMNLDNFNASENSNNSNSFSPGFSARRVSQRLQQGLQSLGLGNNGFGFSTGAKPPGMPPKKSTDGNDGSKRGLNMNMSTGLPKPNSGLDMNSFNSTMMSSNDNTSETFNNSAPPPTFKKSFAQANTNTSNSQLRSPPPKKTTGGPGKKSTAIEAPRQTKAKQSKANNDRAPAVSKKGPPGGGLGGGLLAQIQMGKQLKHAQTNDRSAPKI